ncbi:ABC transporter permease [Herbiconiux sp. SYSU D00978]|uniref:ABC transporter permease n=1 Tax=Herbiconiux sp. SYSU D00978 TaxID=2812562 RepID=UPI001A974329|nr:ABC transporter permease [Herbiconiux sp. SYSU D00978]
MTSQDQQVPTQGQPQLGGPEPGQQPNVKPDDSGSRWTQTARDITGGTVGVSILAVVLALIVGAILIVLTEPDVQATAAYFFARPGDTFREIWSTVSTAYSALFQGAIYNFRRPEFATAIRPLTETLNYATPLIAAGLGVAVAFRVGLFNIGGRGQILIAAAAAGFVGAYVPLPPVLHLIVALLAGIAGGAIFAGIAGLLKARTGAHEVIVTIMLNYVGFYLLSYMLRTPGLLQAPGSNNPEAADTLPTAVLPDLFGSAYNLNLGFILVIAATVFVWYLFSRSSLGFRFRAVGENPDAARVAGINVKNTYVYAMLISGALIGLAGSQQVLGTITTGFSSSIDAGIGFDAITVALLGRSRPLGVFLAGVLFGALKAGGFAMQAAAGVPIDIVLVLQSLIVLLIAAPPLVRTVFRLPTPGQKKPVKPQKSDKHRKAVVTR